MCKTVPHTSTLRYVAECLNATVLVLLTLLTLSSTPHTDNVQMPKSPFELTPWRYTAHREIRHLRTPWTITIMFTKSCRGTPWAGWVQSVPSHSNYRRSVLILSSHLHQCFHSGDVPFDIPTKFLCSFHISPRRYKSHQSHLLWFNLSRDIRYRLSIMKLIIKHMSLFHVAVNSLFNGHNFLLRR